MEKGRVACVYGNGPLWTQALVWEAGTLWHHRVNRRFWSRKNTCVSLCQEAIQLSLLGITHHTWDGGLVKLSSLELVWIFCHKWPAFNGIVHPETIVSSFTHTHFIPNRGTQKEKFLIMSFNYAITMNKNTEAFNLEKGGKSSINVS